jgi:O-acetyl-ADP-ribose deacetylase (regulator of RNase III)
MTPDATSQPHQPKHTVEEIHGDITKLDVDAIVNAANESLMVGGGVDGAIHAAAGPGLEQETRSRYKSCPVGEAVITGGHNLKAKYVIHAVGPRYMDGHHTEPQALASCYKKSLELANEHDLRSIAFPAISTGIYGYPKSAADTIARQAISDYFKQNPHSEVVRVLLVSYSQ